MEHEINYPMWDMACKALCVLAGLVFLYYGATQLHNPKMCDHDSYSFSC